jgi:hypothetical protein
MLLRCYTGLDAFRRGHGSRELFMMLARQLLVAEELCRCGHHQDEIGSIQGSHAAMMHIDAAEKERGVWQMGDGDYARLCQAFEIFCRQLSSASLADIAEAEAKAIEGLLKAKQTLNIAEASE